MTSDFDKVLKLIGKDGIELTFTPHNVAEGDHSLLFSAYSSIRVFIHWRRGLAVVEFLDGVDDSMLLEDFGESFFRSILKVAKEQNKV